MMRNVSECVHQKSTWNRGGVVGQKPPLKLKEIWALRVRLEIANHHRDLALLNLAIDSKLRRLSVSKPHPPLRASQYEAVCADRKVLGCTNWLAPCGLRNPLIA